MFIGQWGDFSYVLKDFDDTVLAKGLDWSWTEMQYREGKFTCLKNRFILVQEE